MFAISGEIKESIKQLLFHHGIPLYTTKTGDFIAVHRKGEKISTVYNLMSDNSAISSTNTFSPKNIFDKIVSYQNEKAIRMDGLFLLLWGGEERTKLEPEGKYFLTS